jgi:hypothetical protein
LNPALEHHGPEIFADVVKSPLTVPTTTHPGARFFYDQQGLDLDQGGIHRPGGDQDFGNEDLVVFKQLASRSCRRSSLR